MVDGGQQTVIGEIQAVIGDIESYCRASGVSESTFGRQAVNDGKFVSRLRSGKGVTLKTLVRVRAYMWDNPPGGEESDEKTDTAEAVATEPLVVGRTRQTPVVNGQQTANTTTPFRFYDNRQKYLAFVTTCNEKWAIAQRAGRELQHIHPSPPALRLFDAGMGDATVLAQLMRDLHRRFPTVPFLVTAKEISFEDVRLGLSKLPDRLFEHPATVFVVTNLNYAEAPWLMPRDVKAAAALNWHEVKLAGHSAYEYGDQIESLHGLLADGWETRSSDKSGNPLYVRPSVLVIYREDHRFLLDPIIPRPGHTKGDYDLVVASQPWRARMSAEFKIQKVLTPLTRSLGPGGRLLAIQAYGDDPGLEIVRKLWQDENPFTVNRHQLLKVLKDELGRDARDFNFNAFSDSKSLFRYHMHTLPTEIGANIGTSTLFAAWNAAIYVNQIEEERIEEVVSSGAYLKATAEVLQEYGGLWFNDETFVISRRRH